MPMYEYRCVDCGRVFEMLRSFSNADRDLKCPVCDSEDIQRLLSSFATAGGSTSGAPGGGCGSGGGGRRFG